jgi:hypothetical protein
MVGKTLLWSFAAMLPLLGLGAWYGAHPGFCCPGCCGMKASVAVEPSSLANTASDCCPEGSCCPECCFPGCCDDGAKAQAEKPAAKVSSAGDCCSGGSCCVAPAAKKTSAAQTGDKCCPPCPFCP